MLLVAETFIAMQCYARLCYSVFRSFFPKNRGCAQDVFNERGREVLSGLGCSSPKGSSRTLGPKV